jgi:hypothetical protein
MRSATRLPIRIATNVPLHSLVLIFVQGVGGVAGRLAAGIQRYVVNRTTGALAQANATAKNKITLVGSRPDKFVAEQELDCVRLKSWRQTRHEIQAVVMILQ